MLTYIKVFFNFISISIFNSTLFGYFLGLERLESKECQKGYSFLKTSLDRCRIKPALNQLHFCYEDLIHITSITNSSTLVLSAKKQM